MTNDHLLLIGCGNMGSAMLTRWLAIPDFAIQHFTVIEPHALPFTASNLTHVSALDQLPKDFAPGIIVLAIKPQQMDIMLPALAKRFGNAPIYVSIAAGKTIRYFEHHLGASTSIIRAMPNTPAMVGEAMSVLIGNPSLSKEARELATQLLNAVGETLWLDDESLMDIVTAISGSGPAYFFYFMECLSAAALENGLPQAIATKLIAQTAKGSIALAAHSPLPLAQLRKNVTSPGGTTEAALSHLMEENTFSNLVKKAITAALLKSHKLSE